MLQIYKKETYCLIVSFMCLYILSLLYVCVVPLTGQSLSGSHAHYTDYKVKMETLKPQRALELLTLVCYVLI